MTTSSQKNELTKWFDDLQARICTALEALEDECTILEASGGLLPELLPGRFQKKAWKRQDCINPGLDGGGGVMAILKGRVFEKAGVNVSTVYGQFAPQFAKDIPGAADDPRFWASGISMVVHPLNPFIPIVHMNTRHIMTTKSWFGGGSDLTPTFEFSEDTADFHQAFRQTCDAYNPDFYPKFKTACDTYFYLPHRQEPRGVGGIFYDNLIVGEAFDDFEKGFDFTKEVGETLLSVYPLIVHRHLKKTWTPEDKQKQLVKRGRYVEFNLLYDRGTHFGLKTNGNTEAIFMSLPPLAGWE